MPRLLLGLLPCLALLYLGGCQLAQPPAMPTADAATFIDSRFTDELEVSGGIKSRYP